MEGEWNRILGELVDLAVPLVGGLMLYFLKRFFAVQHQREEARDRNKAKEYGLLLRSLEALGKLTVANSIALRDGKTNGQMGAALADYEQLEKELHRHLIAVHTGEYRGKEQSEHFGDACEDEI